MEYSLIMTSNNHQCVQLNSINDTLDWSESSANFTIQVQPNMWPPIITYKEQWIISGNTSILYYQWCGPLIVLLKHFAIYIKAKYEFPVKIIKADESTLIYLQ